MSSNAIQSAYAHAGAGLVNEAVRTLEAAGGRGDSTAWAELASWYLKGDPVPRDLALARTALRHAVAIGHVDAALLEVALTASGTGEPADWSGAISLLRSAAATDPVASKHLSLLEQMRLDDSGYPIDPWSPETLSEEPTIFRVRNAFSQAECLHLASVTNDKLEPAIVVDPKSGRGVPHPIRNSHGTAIGPVQEDLVVAALNRRIAAITRTALESGEPLQVLRYAQGQQYRLHSDALSGVANQRVVTAIIYLNQGFAGGETDFPELQLRVHPAAGDMLVFHNALPNGQMDARARHAGLPVTNGVKWIATRWIRAGAHNPWTDHL